MFFKSLLYMYFRKSCSQGKFAIFFTNPEDIL